MKEWAEVWRYRALLWSFVRRDLKVRYKNSVLGFVWSLLNPLLQILVFVIAFRYMMGMGGRNYSAKLFVAMLPWMFFSQGLFDSSASVAAQVSLIKRVYFPRLILPLSVVMANLVHFLLGMAVLSAYFAVRKVTIAWPHLPLAFLGFGVQFVFMCGIAFAVSSLSVYYNDVKFLLASIVQMWMFLSPIFYSAEGAIARLGEMGLPQFLGTLYMLNPMAPVLMSYHALLPYEGARTNTNDYLVALHQLLPRFPIYFAIAGAVALVAFVLGFLLFRRLQWRFAELG
jgi:ABC-2 type transport system permease protein